MTSEGLQDSGPAGDDEVTLLSLGHRLKAVLSLKGCSWLPFKLLEICIFGKAWCEVMSNNGPSQIQGCAWGTKKELHFSSRHGNLQSRYTPTSSCDVGNKYVCMVGCGSGVAFFTVTRVFKPLSQDGMCEGNDQKRCVLLREFIQKEKRKKPWSCKSVSFFIYIQSIYSFISYFGLILALGGYAKAPSRFENFPACLKNREVGEEIGHQVTSFGSSLTC